MADIANTWEKIQQGLKETEHLFNQKQYNLSMIKARQTLEYMVKILAERACIVEEDISNIIDQLYEGRWITKTAKEHYHKLRIIGNKAVHEGNDNVSDANLAYHILLEEVSGFADEYSSRQRRLANSSASRPRTVSSRSKNSSSSKRRRTKKQKSSFKDFLRMLFPIITVILLILIIRFIAARTEKNSNETAASTTPSAPSESFTMEPLNPSDETPLETTTDVENIPIPETTTAAVLYRTATTLNVREEPSTTARILSQLEPGVQVTVTGVYDEQWSIILYDGQDAYVATAYLTH